MREPKQPDTQKMIDHCLECPFEKCWNCFGRHTAYSYGLRMKLDDGYREKRAKLVLKAAMTNKGEGYGK